MLSEHLNNTIPCSCGKLHSFPGKDILIEENAIQALPSLLLKNGLHKPFLLYDITTNALVGSLLEDILLQSDFHFDKYILSDQEPTPNEGSLGEILIHLDQTCDTLIAVGSGTINDLGRFLSYKLSIPYMILATAPSMDGFASNVSPLIVKHMKTTFEAQVPYAILGDLIILKDAPMNMISAGIGDILGKCTCLADWKIANIITGEYHCERIEALVRQSLTVVMANATHAKDRALMTVKSIMEALVLSGIAMSYAGNSRPASGSEHHLSHYWEMMYLFDGKRPILHGTKVGIATVAVARAYELLMEYNIDFSIARERANDYSEESWKNKMHASYLGAVDAVIALEKQTHKNAPEQVVARLNRLEENWDRIKMITADIPAADTLRDILRSLDAPTDPMSVGIDRNTFINSFLVAKELRNRYGLLQILFDLGLAEEIAAKVWEYF